MTCSDSMMHHVMDCLGFSETPAFIDSKNLPLKKCTLEFGNHDYLSKFDVPFALFLSVMTQMSIIGLVFISLF